MLDRKPICKAALQRDYPKRQSGSHVLEGAGVHCRFWRSRRNARVGSAQIEQFDVFGFQLVQNLGHVVNADVPAYLAEVDDLVQRAVCLQLRKCCIDVV